MPELSRAVEPLRLKDGPPTPRQQAYVRQAAQRSASRRADRLARLERDIEGLQRALLDYGTVSGNWRPMLLHLGRIFVAPERDTTVSVPGDAPGAPPMMRLLRSRGEALRLYLVMLYVAQVVWNPAAGPLWEALPQFSSTDPCWHSLLGYSHLPKRSRDSRMTRSLVALEAESLVRLDPPGRHGRYSRFHLLSESGFGVDYRLPVKHGPRRPPGTFGIQCEFFRQGWHLTLTDAELGTYLVLLHKAVEQRKKPSTQPFFLGRSERLLRYQLGDDSYGAHRELTEFGLLRMIDDEPARRRGRISAKHLVDGRGPRPFRFTITSAPRSAPFVVRSKLARGLPAPHLRITDHSRGKTGPKVDAVLEDVSSPATPRAADRTRRT